MSTFFVLFLLNEYNDKNECIGWTCKIWRTERKTQKWKKMTQVFVCTQGRRWERTNKVKKLLFSRRIMPFNRTLERSNIYCNVSNELNSSEIETWLFLFVCLSKNIINLFFLINMIGFSLFKSRKEMFFFHWHSQSEIMRLVENFKTKPI